MNKVEFRILIASFYRVIGFENNLIDKLINSAVIYYYTNHIRFLLVMHKK